MNSRLQERNMIAVIFLYLLTFGIYPLYIYFKFGAELKKEVEEKNVEAKLVHPFVALLLAFITFGIYSLFYVYKQAEALEILGKRRNVIAYAPVLILILQIFVGIGGLLNVHTGSMIASSYNNGSDSTIEIL